MPKKPTPAPEIIRVVVDLEDLEFQPNNYSGWKPAKDYLDKSKQAKPVEAIYEGSGYLKLLDPFFTTFYWYGADKEYVVFSRRSNTGGVDLIRIKDTTYKSILDRYQIDKALSTNNGKKKTKRRR